MGSILNQLRSAPLSTLIALAQAEPSDDSPAMRELISRFERLTQRVARGMTLSRPDLTDDVANACRLAFVRAVRRHDVHRAGFPSYAEHFMRGAALRELRRWQRPAAEELTAAVDDDLRATEDELDQVVIDQLAPWGDGAVSQLVQDLSPDRRKLLTMRYVHDAPLDVIAATCGTSASAVSQRLATIHRKVALAAAA